MTALAEWIRRFDESMALCMLRNDPYHGRHFRIARNQNLTGREKIAFVRSSSRLYALVNMCSVIYVGLDGRG